MKASMRRGTVRRFSVLWAWAVLALGVVGCKEPALDYGTVTVKLTNVEAEEEDGKAFVFGVFPDVPDPEDWSNAVGVGAALIAGAEAQSLAMEAVGWKPDDITTWVVKTFPLGSTYYAGAMIDMDGSRTVSENDFIYIGDAFTVNGNVRLILDRADFAQVPSPP
jgi:hypothetical protein